MLPGPLRSSEGPPRIWKARRPVQRQASVSGLAFQHDVHRSAARSCWNSPGRNIGVSLEWQLDDLQPMLDEDGVSALPDVAERANEVVPMQHIWKLIHKP